MLFQKNNLSRIIVLITVTFTVVMGILLFLSPPAVFPDAGWGFQAMRSMQMGGGFNQLITPNQDDITKNTTEFLTWWSPGQYLIPLFFKWLFGINTGQAVALTITLCQLSAIAGFYYFFKKIGFSPLIASLSVAFIISQQFYALNYIFYNGGEVLLFAFAGWFLYGCTALQKPNWQLCLFVLFAGWIGFFCKSSILWIYAAGLLFLWIRLSLPQKNVRNYIKNGLWVAIPSIISLLSIYIFFLSKGENPASAPGHLKLAWQTFSFPFASPLLAGFSVDDLSHGLLFPSGTPIFGNTLVIIIIVTLSIASLLLIVAIVHFISNNNYRLLILVFYAVSVAFFSYAYLRQMNISYEGRHYRVVGIIIVPGIFYLLWRIKPGYRICFGLIWVGIVCSSFYYLARGYAYNRDKGAHGNAGIAQLFIDQPALIYIMELDHRQHNALFAFTRNSLGLEIKQNRIITLENDIDFDHVNFEDYEYDGHAGPLYILLPANYKGKKSDVILKFFPGYKNFTTTPLSPQYTLYSAN
ncbi:MAG: hypothetical protein ABI203_00455 [Mucilaginibacter sp.]